MFHIPFWRWMDHLLSLLSPCPSFLMERILLLAVIDFGNGWTVYMHKMMNQAIGYCSD